MICINMISDPLKRVTVVIDAIRAAFLSINDIQDFLNLPDKCQGTMEQESSEISIKLKG